MVQTLKDGERVEAEPTITLTFESPYSYFRDDIVEKEQEPQCQICYQNHPTFRHRISTPLLLMNVTLILFWVILTIKYVYDKEYFLSVFYGIGMLIFVVITIAEVKREKKRLNDYIIEKI